MAHPFPSNEKARGGQVLLHKDVDREVNALFSALCHDLGSRFIAAGTRNYRTIVGKWDPLRSYIEDLRSPDIGVGRHVWDGTPGRARVFARDYILSHFFDRYFDSAERLSEYQNKLEVEAWEKFHANITRGWLSDAVSPLLLQDDWFGRVIREASLIVGRALGPLDKEEVFGKCRHGPNSTVGLEFKDAYLGVKSLRFDGCEDVQELFSEYLRWDTTLGAELSKYLPNPERPAVSLVDTSTLSFVDKSWKARRAITPQPNLMLFFQLGTGEVISSALQRVGIDIRTQQDCHRKLVKFASANPDAGICTLDWSEASNRIWLWLVEAIFPRDWYNWLLLIRTPQTVYGGESHDLPFIGEMGNGFTFPLQTLLFYAVLRAIARVENHSDGEYVSVFGDDCIVDAGIMPGVLKFAKMASWTLNENKSFVHGWFKESCGQDSFAGEAVRPFMVRRPENLTSRSYLRAWSYSVYNGIQRTLAGRWSMDHVQQWLEQFHHTYRLGTICVVPPRFGDASGIRCEAAEVALLDDAKYHIPRLYDGTMPRKFEGCISVRGIASEQERVNDWVFPYYHSVLRRSSASTEDLVDAHGGSPCGLSMRGDWMYQTTVPQSIHPDGSVASRNKEDLCFYERSFNLHTWSYWLD